MRTKNSPLVLAIAASVALTLSGCGGGGSSGSQSITDGGSIVPDNGSTPNTPTPTLNSTGDSGEGHVFTRWGLWGG